MLTAALLAAVALLVGLTLPPRHLTLTTPWTDSTVRGILHVHTNRSDGLSAPDTIAEAAARAGLSFVIFTDHGDGTRTPDPPAYRAGVLCLDGVEISTAGGHYIALDLSPAPYPLGGEGRDVVEDVQRLGGFGIVAHPDSPKPELRWRDWSAPFDSLELINPDTAWRIHYNRPGLTSKLKLLVSLVDYPFRPAETLTALLQQPADTIARWDALTRRRRVVGLSGVDAHAKLAPRNADPGDNRAALPVPSYESSFRMMSLHVRPDQPLTGNAGADAAVILRALRAGHAYTSIDGLATPPAFELTATNDRGTAFGGDELVAGGPVTIRVRSNAPSDYTAIVHEGARVLSGDHHEPEFTVQVAAAPAVYWAEIVATRHDPPIAWILSNPVYVRAAGQPTQLPVRPAATVRTPLFDGESEKGWGVEADPLSAAALDVTSTGDVATLRMRYGLGGGDAAGQYAGLIASTPGGLGNHDRLAFTVRAEQPMRISVQLRAGGSSDMERWRRSVYVDTSDRDRVIFFSELAPIGATGTWRPEVSKVHAILFVVDTTNTKPGASGRLWISKASLQR